MEKFVFDNGLTVALTQKQDTHSAAISIYVAAGNRYEEKTNSGISHFIEHMVFKGTTTRSTNDIAEESDIMGGQLNAYTAKEYTCFYSRALSEHVPRTLHLMCDMLCNPLFDENELNTEKGVVLEEIGMYEDSPEDFCSDMLTAVCYKEKPLGFNILGTRQTVAGFTAQDLRDYMAKLYVPERIVVSVCGKFCKESVLEILQKYFGSRRNTGNPLKYEKMVISGGFSLVRRDIEQTQLAFCFNGLPLDHPLKYASSFFTSITGGAASSKINRRIREELGLAYSAYTFTSNYLGTGVFGVFAGLAPKNQEKFLVESLKILKSAKEDITQEDVERTKEQFKAGVVLSNDSMSAIAASVGRQLLLEGEYVDIEGVLKRINEVSVDSVKEAAILLTNPETIALSVVGDVESEGFYKDVFNNFLLAK